MPGNNTSKLQAAVKKGSLARPTPFSISIRSQYEATGSAIFNRAETFSRRLVQCSRPRYNGFATSGNGIVTRQTSQMISKRTSWLIRIGLMVAVLLAVECVIGYIIPGTYSEVIHQAGLPTMLTHSDYLVFTLPPNFAIPGYYGPIQTNALGYRGPNPTTINKPANTFRALFLGDSITLGWKMLPAQRRHCAQGGRGG